MSARSPPPPPPGLHYYFYPGCSLQRILVSKGLAGLLGGGGGGGAEGSWTWIRQKKKSLAGRLSREGGWEGAASSRSSRLGALGAGASVAARECECVSARRGRRVASSGAGSRSCPRPAREPGEDKARFGGGGWGGVGGWRVRVAGCECECARASGRESGSHSSEAHTDMFDRRDMTRAREEAAAAAGAGPRTLAPA